MNNNHKLTESDNKNIDVKLQLEHPIQVQETKESGWISDKINSIKIRFYKTGVIKGSRYVKIPLESNAILKTEIRDKFCFLSSKLASLHSCKSDHHNGVSNYKQFFNELNIEGFDFSNRFKCSDGHKFEKLNNLSINIFELNIYLDKKMEA